MLANTSHGALVHRLIQALPDLHPPVNGDFLAIRVVARALTGMQKEALVQASNTNRRWQFLCDEGPYLNGTDLAPPPLAFFCAGASANYATHILAAAKAQDSHLDAFRMTVDHRFSMDGSALRGTMLAGALPTEVEVRANRVSKEDLSNYATAGVTHSPADSLTRLALVDQFTIALDGAAIDMGDIAACARPVPTNADQIFAALSERDDWQKPLPEVIGKLMGATTVQEADHGVGAALKDQQKRILHLRSELEVRPNGLHQVRVQILKPIGSVFQFLIDSDATSERAPDGLSLMAAGLAFCFMTQIGRYAHITKKNLRRYSVVQDMFYDLIGHTAQPVETHTFFESNETAASIRQTVNMSERTCFLHAACRSANKTHIRVAVPST